MSARHRAAFTLIEVLMSLTIVALLSSIAVPKYREMRRRATATQILGDFDVLRHAALSFYVDSQYFPAEAPQSQVPPGLKQYLPNGFKMTKPQWEWDYDNWSDKKMGTVIGISYRTIDANLGRTAMKLVGNTPGYFIGTKYTFFISGF